jgi:hypothetical protein
MPILDGPATFIVENWLEWSDLWENVDVAAAMRRKLGTKAAHQTKSQAMEILKERFARSEIDKAEFEERRQVLASG